MASFACYKTVPPEEVRKCADKLLKDIPAWFAANPKRKVCRVQWLYGQTLRLTRKNYEQEIEAVAGLQNSV